MLLALYKNKRQHWMLWQICEKDLWSKCNSLFLDGKIYKVTFSNGSVCIGSTCGELETRFKWHLLNKNS